MNTHPGNEDFHTATRHPANRKVFSRIQGFSPGGFQRQINVDRHVMERDWIVVKIGMLGNFNLEFMYSRCLEQQYPVIRIRGIKLTSGGRNNVEPLA